jgi:hypothetical protein
VFGAFGVSLLLALTLVFAVTQQPASADLIDGTLQMVPVAAGTAVATGVCVGGGCEVAAVTGVIVGSAMVVGWGLHSMHAFGWGSGHTVETGEAAMYGSGLTNHVLLSQCCGHAPGYSPAPGSSLDPTPYIAIYPAWPWSASTAVTVGEKCVGTAPTFFNDTVTNGQTWGWGIYPCGTPNREWVRVWVGANAVDASTVDSSADPGADIKYENLATAAPDHKWRGVKICHGGGGDTTYTSYSAVFKEADSSLPDFPNTDCPAGTLATSYTVYEGDATGAGGPQVLTWTAPSSWANPSSVTYSDCLPGGSAAPCTVRLLKATPFGLYDCASGSVDCTDFDPSTSTTQQYQCQWGTHVMALDQCIALKQAPATTPVGSTTGTPQDVQAPASDGEAAPVGPQQSNASCIGQVTWNPISWVLKPIKCALTWAFVPDPATLSTQINGVRTAVAGSSLGAAYTPVNEVASAWGQIASGQSGGCLGPGFTLSVPGKTMDLNPLSACSSPMSNIAAITKASCAIGVMIGAVLLVVRILAGAFGVSVGGLGRGGDE